MNRRTALKAIAVLFVTPALLHLPEPRILLGMTGEFVQPLVVQVAVAGERGEPAQGRADVSAHGTVWLTTSTGVGGGIEIS